MSDESDERRITYIKKGGFLWLMDRICLEIEFFLKI
jgi:hypothetical protein